MKGYLKKFVFVFSLFILFASNIAYGESVNVHLRVKVGDRSLYNSNISVAPCDSDNNGSLDEATAYCALSQAGLDLNGSWSSFGYFLEAIDGINGYPDSNGGEYHYWAFYTNGQYSMTGASSYILEKGDVILFDFTDPSEEDISKVKIKSGGILWRDEFSVNNAIKFLSLEQKDNGSFGDYLYTDWVAIGVSKIETGENEIKNKLIEYLKKEDFKAINITDYERRAMALMSLGINPYTGTKINYIKKIIESFDGQQIGDKNLINDDIFALIVLQNAGYNKEDKIISSVISNIIKTQGINGSWGSVDITSASIMSLYDFKSIDGVKDSIYKAFKFIKSNEVIKGSKSFGNTFTASWAMQAFSTEDWYDDEIERSSKFLARKQDNEDGFMKEINKESSIWATAYAIPAFSNLDWNDILDNFSKEI